MAVCKKKRLYAFIFRLFALQFALHLLLVDYFQWCKYEIKYQEGEDEVDRVVSVEQCINDKYYQKKQQLEACR